jgi:hypothetical protein
MDHITEQVSFETCYDPFQIVVQHLALETSIGGNTQKLYPRLKRKLQNEPVSKSLNDLAVQCAVSNYDVIDIAVDHISKEVFDGKYAEQLATTKKIT